MTGADLDERSANLSAYEAAMGYRGSIYDPEPLSINNPPPEAYIAGMTGGSTGGTGGTGAAPDVPPWQSSDPAVRLEYEVQDWAEDRQKAAAVIAQAYGAPIPYEQLDPISKQVVDGMLAQYGWDAPRLSEEGQGYLAWASQQPDGADVSAAAYIRWRDEQYAARRRSAGLPASVAPSFFLPNPAASLPPIGGYGGAGQAPGFGFAFPQPFLPPLGVSAGSA